MSQRTLFRLLLVGLPVGLAASVVIALYLYYNPLDFPLPGRPKRTDAAAMMRRSPNETDLRDYRRLLSTDLDTSTSASPEAVRTTANWIASTLGPSNVGLSTSLLEPGGAIAGENSAPAPIVLVEVPGSRLRNEVVLSVTGYRGSPGIFDPCVATSTMMTVAGAFAGTPQRRTLVFAFLPGETGDASLQAPLEAVVKSLTVRRLLVRGVLDFRVSPAPLPPANGPAARAHWRAMAPDEASPWTGEVREAIAPRKPATLSFDFARSDEAPQAARSLAGWSGSIAPYVLLVLTPAAPNDESAPLAAARTLEGVIQALANQ